MKQPGSHIIHSLLEKHSLGILTPEERVLLEKWYADFPQKGEVWVDGDEKAAMKDAMKAGIFGVIAAGEIKMTPVKPPVRRIWWAAAAVMVGVTLIWLLYSKKEPAYVVITAAAGKGIVSMQLPDQSEMWLEPGTKVRYQEDFGKHDRQITLMDGMAFFSVREQSAYPFIVTIPGGVQAKVLGTSFSVKKYIQSEKVAVMVSSGAVQVADSTGVLGILKAGQQLSYEVTRHTVARTAGEVADWRNGNLTISDASLAEVVRILENYYGLQVIVDVAANTAYRFTFRISRQDTAEDVLAMLKDISGLEYTRSGNTLTIH